jgi:predicted nucleotidyltransferase
MWIEMRKGIKIRLNESEIKIIKDTIKGFDKNARVYLFGSRTEGDKKGGDIDLLIMSDKLTGDDKSRIKLKLFDKIGEQKIDIIIAGDKAKPFVRIAMDKGVLL